MLNGADQAGLATDVEQTLHGLGFHTVLATNADRASYQHTWVIENTPAGGSADYTARRLQRDLHAEVVRRSMPALPARLVVIVGNDFP